MISRKDQLNYFFKFSHTPQMFWRKENAPLCRNSHAERARDSTEVGQQVGTT